MLFLRFRKAGKFKKENLKEFSVCFLIKHFFTDNKREGSPH